jgi:hypothetical protein
MYTAIKGTLINGQVIFEEPPPITQNMSVVVILMEEKPKPAPARQPGSLLKLGASQGKTYKLPDDFNDPLEDLQEYMG